MTDLSWLDAIEARLAASTPGPWNFAYAPREDSQETKAEYLANTCDMSSDEPVWVCWVPDPDGKPDDYVIPALTGDGPTSRDNAEFIANAPADIARLVSALRERDAALARVEREASAMEALAGDMGAPGRDAALRLAARSIRAALTEEES